MYKKYVDKVSSEGNNTKKTVNEKYYGQLLIVEAEGCF